MSASSLSHRITTASIRARKNASKKIVCLTAATAPIAEIIDPYCDVILVGDSLMMTIYGMENTQQATLDIMIQHARAVMRASQRACVVVDMPKDSCHNTPQQTYDNARRILTETQAQAIKIEGGQEMAPTIQFMTEKNIAVMAHVGLMPQTYPPQKKYKVQGETIAQAKKIIADAQATARAGAFACVIEATYKHVADTITQTIAIPTIGIGASPQCDGQILVTDDMLGLYRKFTPQFLKRYTELAAVIETAVQNYAQDVQNGLFPSQDHCFQLTKKKNAK